MSFTDAADRMCSSPGQTLVKVSLVTASSTMTLRLRSAAGSCSQRSPQREGGRAWGREGTSVIVGTSLLLIPCVKSVTALEF